MFFKSLILACWMLVGWFIGSLTIYLVTGHKTAFDEFVVVFVSCTLASWQTRIENERGVK